MVDIRILCVRVTEKVGNVKVHIVVLGKMLYVTFNAQSLPSLLSTGWIQEPATALFN